MSSSFRTRSSSVAGVIEPALQAAETARLAGCPTDDLAAYDLYLRGYTPQYRFLAACYAHLGRLDDASHPSRSSAPPAAPASGRSSRTPAGPNIARVDEHNPVWNLPGYHVAVSLIGGLVDALNTALAVQIMRRFVDPTAIALAPSNGLSRERLRRVRDYVEAHLGDRG
jgi:hypothetical protein